MTLPFEASIDIRDAVWYKDVMEYGLGPNEEILTFEQGEDGTIRTKTVLLHHVLVPHRVMDINASLQWQCHHHNVMVNGIDIFETNIFSSIAGIWTPCLLQNKVTFLRNCSQPLVFYCCILLFATLTRVIALRIYILLSYLQTLR